MKNLIKKMLVMALTILTIMSLSGCGKKTEDASAAEETASIDEDASTDDALTDDEDVNEDDIEEAIPEETVDPIKQFWAGDWFGYMWIETADGGLSEWSNCYWDAMATIDVDDNGNADMLLWYESLSREQPAGHVQLSISADSGSGEMGAAISESGWVFVDSDTGNGDINHADWIIDPMTDTTSAKFGNDMIHFYGEYIEGDGSLYYHYFLRKWGSYWDDVAKDEEELIPRGYDFWYKPLIDDGYAMPNNIGEEGTVKMDDANASGSASIDSSSTTEANSSTNGNDAPASTYDGGELVLIDNEFCKITVVGTGSNPYNDSWIGYMVVLENKTDHSMYFTSYADPDLNVQTVSSLGKGNTCYYGGEVTSTHMGYTVNPGKTISDGCLAIDGVTDVSQLGNVHGYISVSNNETGEVLANVPYSF